MTRFGFAFPTHQWPLWLLAGAAVLLLLVFLLRRFERQRARRMYAFVEATLTHRLLLGYDARVRRPLFWCALLGCALLLLALAQPRWGEDWVETTRASRDILLVLDTSESMNAQDILPNRLERARQKAMMLVRRNPGDRFGLIAFSGGAVLMCPLTQDHAYLLTVLNAVHTDTITEEGTDLEDALREALVVFRQDARETGDDSPFGRAVVLLSDGEEVEGNALPVARELARFATIYTIGVGTPEGAEIHFPQWMLRYTRPPEVAVHHTRLDEDNLSQIALQSADGVYVRSTPDNSDIDYIHAEMQDLAARMVAGELRMQLINRYRWPLALAILFFALEGAWIVAMPHVRHWRMRRGHREAEDIYV